MMFHHQRNPTIPRRLSVKYSVLSATNKAYDNSNYGSLSAEDIARRTWNRYMKPLAVKSGARVNCVQLVRWIGFQWSLYCLTVLLFTSADIKRVRTYIYWILISYPTCVFILLFHYDVIPFLISLCPTPSPQQTISRNMGQTRSTAAKMFCNPLCRRIRKLQNGT